VVIIIKKETKETKIVNLCAEDSCCPVVKIADEHVEIGEYDNPCILSTGEWELLKQKILNGDI
jgi:hypothetical protein